MSAAQIREALRSPNVEAFERVIRQGESNQIDEGPNSAWSIINGGSHFTDFTHHPFGRLKTTEGGKAAGACQWLPTTYADLQDRYPEDIRDFTKSSQKFAFAAKLVDRGALQDVLAGRLEDAIGRCRKEWTSLPGAAENTSYTLERARQVFRQYGGTEAGYVKPAPVPIPTPAPTKRFSMPIAALIATFGPMLANLIPQIAKLFSSGSEVATRNVAAAEAVFDTVVKVSNAANIQDAIERMQSDPNLQATVTQAVVTDPVIMGLLEVGGGIDKAREANLTVIESGKPIWTNPAFVIFCLLSPLLYIVVVAVVFNLGKDWSDEMRSVVVTAIVTGLLGSITGYFFGSSYGSQKKTELAAR